MDRINFCGGFLIRKPKPEVWEKLEKTVMPNHKCYIPKYNEQGDKFLAVKRRYDYDIAKFIKDNGLECIYYPDICLKTQIDSRKLDEAKEIINKQTNFIVGTKNLKNAIKVKADQFLLGSYIWKRGDYVQKTLDALRLNPDSCTVVTNKKTLVSTIYRKGKGNENKVVAKMSPNNHNGTNFVYVLPTRNNPDSRKIAIDRKGGIIEFPTLAFKDFEKNFMAAIAMEKTRLKIT